MLTPLAAPDISTGNRDAVGRIATLTIAVALLVLAADAVLSLTNVAALRSNQKSVEHTQAVLTRIQRLRALTVEVVSQTRGFLLDGDTDFLQRIPTTEADVWAQLADFRQTTNDNPVQTRNADRLAGQTRNLIAALHRKVASRRRVGVTGEALPIGASLNELDGIRQTLGDMEAEESHLLEQRNRFTQDSATRTVVTFLTAVVVSVGLIVLIYSMAVRDARQRKREAAELARLAQYNRLLIESSGEGIYGVDTDGLCTFVNAAGSRMFGMDPAAAIGLRMHDLTHHHRADGSAYPAEQCPIYQVHRDGQACRVADEVFFRADGTSFPVEYTASPIVNNGRIEGAVVTFADVTQRKADELAARQASEKLADMADNIPQLAWMAEGNGSIFWYNKRWYEYTGTTLEQMRGAGWKSVHDPAHVDATAAKFAACVRAGTEWEDTFALRAKDGQYRWFLSRAVPIRDGRGEVVRWFGTNTDVTRQREVEEALRHSEERQRAAKADAEAAQEQAETANLSKSQFLANMSHELRTPLNAVIMYSELLQEEAEDQNVPGFIPDLDKIRAAGKHLLALVNGVLDLSKIESGKMELYLETFDVAGMVQDVTATIQPLVQKKHNSLNLDVPPGLGQMYADLTKVRQILFNLLSNASKFTDRGSVSLIVTRGSDPTGTEAFEFKVTDSGIGLTAEQIARLFQPFTQADASTTRKFGGTGLGLAISKRFCEMMGGNIGVTSEPGHGSTFTFRLPAKVRKPVVDTAPAGAALPAGGNADEHAVRVLVIDDEPAVRDLMTRSLASQSIRAITAADGEEGLRLAREQTPDLIFLDVLMPKMDGWAVLTALKADPRLAEVPVIMLTMMSDQEMGYLLGASEYLTKPIDRNRLLAVLDKYKPTDAENGVLIVEDDEATRQVLRRTMERQHWVVTEANNGHVGLERLKQRTPGLILLDLMMPEMDGFEFLAELRHQVAYQHIPVVVLTSKDLTAEERSLLSGKVERILQKGQYSRDALLREVRKIVDDCAARRAEGGPPCNDAVVQATSELTQPTSTLPAVALPDPPPMTVDAVPPAVIH